MTTHPIPAAALAQHLAILGKTGSGKTSTAKLAVEQVVAEGARVCVLDPIKSDWWGLISSADGKRPGLPFHILGGPHGHVPLPSSAGKAAAELVASGALPLSIIDMADFEPGGLQRFFVEFAPTLLRRMRGVVYLVIEEAHEFAPKERSGIGNENLALHWAKKLATAGRAKGLRMIIATQRTQSLHNALLGSCETMIVHRLTMPADQAAVKKWFKDNADGAVLATVARDLPSLRTGTGFIYSGEAGIFEKVTFPRIKTFDNTATPTGDDTAQAVTTAPVDRDKLRAIIGDAVKEAEANDPKTLRAEIADLRKQLAKAPAAQTAPDPQALAAAEQQGYSNVIAEEAPIWVNRGFTAGIDAARKSFDKIDVVTAVHAEVATWKAMGAIPKPSPASSNGRTSAFEAVNRGSNPRAGTNGSHAPVVRPAVAVPKGDGTLTGPQLQLLRALAWWDRMGNAAPTRAQVAALNGWKAGHLKNVAGSLSTQGLVRYPETGKLAMTPEGAALAPEPDTGATVVQGIRSMLTGPQRQLFDLLYGARKAMTRDDIAEHLGWAAGHLKNVAGSLSTLEFVEYPSTGIVGLRDWVIAA